VQLTNGFVALVIPILLAKSVYGAYFLFGGLSFGTFVILALYMPETRGEALETIQELFSRPLRLRGISTLKKLFPAGRKGTARSASERIEDLDTSPARDDAAVELSHWRSTAITAA
jgi:hypothetical protein